MENQNGESGNALGATSSKVNLICQSHIKKGKHTHTQVMRSSLVIVLSLSLLESKQQHKANTANKIKRKTCSD